MKVLCTLLFLQFALMTKGFLFDLTKDSGECNSLKLFCPPGCASMTPSGCKCDCAHHFDPSNPGNTFNGGNKTPKPNISGGSCNTDWRNCHQPCATKSNPVSGCIECSCPAVQTTTPVQTPTPVAKMSSRTTEHHNTVHSNSQQSSAISTTSKPTSMSETQTLLTAKHTSTAPQPLVQSTEISTKSKVSTEIKFPDVFTTPHVPAPEVTSYQTTKGTTLHMIVCAEVFDCDLECYTGYSTDDSGCPLCKCAPLPTGFV
ncbi:uncharacterized protein LOC134719551 isoform X1 [Mytilus trossulus]|uniref:uncharacterized protein LOC134719551 isoform X1 n=1 Tax=Mytilus trossulus TaxID=6551 RepID=UPI003005FD7C